MVNLNLNKVRPRSHKLPKICVFGLKKLFFFAKIDRNSPKCTKGGGGSLV